MKEFEIRTKRDKRKWERQPKKLVSFKNRSEAITFCKYLCLFIQKEVRLDINGNGFYISPIDLN